MARSSARRSANSCTRRSDYSRKRQAVMTTSTYGPNLRERAGTFVSRNATTRTLANLAALVCLALLRTQVGYSNDGAHEAAAARSTSRLLRDVKTAEENGRLVVSLIGDGPLQHEHFLLPNPPRLVVDLRNVEN